MDQDVDYQGGRITRKARRGGGRKAGTLPWFWSQLALRTNSLHHGGGVGGEKREAEVEPEAEKVQRKYRKIDIESRATGLAKSCWGGKSFFENRTKRACEENKRERN